MSHNYDESVQEFSKLFGTPKLYLEFDMTHLQFPIDEVYVNGGGMISGAAARGGTNMMLTGCTHSVKSHLTETPANIRIEVPSDHWTWDKDGHVILSNRTHLIICSHLSATPAVNVVLAESISGELTLKVSELFDRNVDGKFVPASGAAVSHYGAWMNANNTYGFRNVRFVSGDGDEFRPHFQNDEARNLRMSKAEQILQSKYDHSWDVRSAVVLKIMTNLTKPVSYSSFGINGSKYTPSFAIANRIFPHGVETLEDLLMAAISFDLGSQKDILAFCNVSSSTDAAKYACFVVTAISLITNCLMPYRSDGVLSSSTGNNVKFIESEMWTNHSTKDLRADDCEGSTAMSVGIVLAIQRCGQEVDKTDFPFVVASAKALTHYTPGMAVVAATAGHADNASDSPTNVAGHCTAVLIKNCALLRALHEMSTSYMQPQNASTDTTSNSHFKYFSSAKSDKEMAIRLADARLNSIYNAHKLAQLSAQEVECIKKGWIFFEANNNYNLMPNILVAEGTSPCASRCYTNDEKEREVRASDADACDRIFQQFSPSIARAYRWLDSSHDGKNKFYSVFAELILSEPGLYTDSYLRSSEDATSHLVFTQRSKDGRVHEAGATPKQLSKGDFGLVPLFTMGEDDGHVFDEAVLECDLNTMRACQGVHELNDFQCVNMNLSIKALEELKDHIPREPTCAIVTEVSWIISFAALANNPSGIRVFTQQLMSIEGLSGDINVHPIRNLAINKNDTPEDMGAFVSLRLFVPTE